MTDPIRRPHRFWRAFYDRVAFAYDAVLNAGAWLRVGSEQRIREEVIGSLQFAKGGRVIEIGCGTGANRLHLRGCPHYVGLDISRGMLARAKRKCAKLGLGADFVQADTAALPFAGRAADLVLAMGVLQHVPNPAGAIGEMQRVRPHNSEMLIIDERRAQNRVLASISEKNSVTFWGDYFLLQLSTK